MTQAGSFNGIEDAAVGAAAPDGGPHVKVFSSSTGGLLSSFLAYDPNFRSGVTVAAGPVGNSGAAIVTGTGAGGGPQVNVFNVQGVLMAVFNAYDARFRGGVTVTLGD